MKLRWCVVLLLASRAALAQREAMTVPLSDPARPAAVKVHLVSGAIVVRGGDVKEISVGSDARQPLSVDQRNNVVRINGSPSDRVRLTLTVPRKTSLYLRIMAGERIDVSGVDGDLDVDTMSGPVTLKNVSGSVVANSFSSPLVVVIDRADTHKPMAFSSFSADIDVTLPATLQPNVVIRSGAGKVSSDFDLHHGSGPELQFTNRYGKIFIRKR